MWLNTALPDKLFLYKGEFGSLNNMNGFKRHRWLFLILLSLLLLVLAIVPIMIFTSIPSLLLSTLGGNTDQNIPVETLPNGTPSTPTAVPTPTPAIIEPTTPGTPALEKLEQVTTQAFANPDLYVPNSWGVQKNRVIRTSSGDVFTVFTSPGPDNHNTQWHLMHRKPDGSWEQVNEGNAGTEPINILRGPNDEIHLFAWPGTQGKLLHFVSTDLGKTFISETIPGQWTNAQGYSGAAIDPEGNIVFFQSGDDQPGRFLWTYYTAAAQQWQFHISQFDWRYTYAFFFLGNNHDLTITAVRDVKREELGYAQKDGFDYLLNSIKYFYISDVNHPNLTQKVVTQVQPQSNQDTDVTYLTDSYMDTQGRTHILYHNQYDGPHHIIIENGQVIRDVKLNIESANKARIIQDAVGHFYIITMDESGKTLNVYPGSASDTDGTQLNAPVNLDISQYPGCTDPDFCHEPTFTVPRAGNPLSNTLDGTYGNFNKEFYFRLKLR